MALRAGRQQQRHIRQISSRSPGKIIGWKDRCHHLQLSVIRLLHRALPTGSQPNRQ